MDDRSSIWMIDHPYWWSIIHTDDLSSIWMICHPYGWSIIHIHDPWSKWTGHGPDGSNMARTGRCSSSNILRVTKDIVKTFTLRDFHVMFVIFDIFSKCRFIFVADIDFIIFLINIHKYPFYSFPGAPYCPPYCPRGPVGPALTP